MITNNNINFISLFQRVPCIARKVEVELLYSLHPTFLLWH